VDVAAACDVNKRTDRQTDRRTTCNLITSRGKAIHIRIYLIFKKETTITGLHFAADNIGLPSKNFFSGGLGIFCYFGRSRSSKVTDIGDNSKAHMWLPIGRRNLGPILHRFGDQTGFMCFWPDPYSALILGVFPLHQKAHVGVSELMGLKLFGREIIFEEFQPMWWRYLIVTDRRTDRQADRRTTCNLITALCVASRGKKA